MLIRTRFFVIVSAIACVFLVVLLYRDHMAAAAGAKFIASSAFIATAISAGAWSSRYGRIILLGLSLSWFGDMFLIGESRQLFLAGLAAFLLAHLAYVAAFIVHGISRRWLYVALLPVAIVAALVFSWLSPHVPADLALPVRAYTVVISAMVVLAIATRGAHGSLLIVSGALLFYFSDLSVAAQRLLQTDMATYVWGLPFYFAGQLCLALSCVRPALAQAGRINA
jgi:uncharacterized membrane protein YhhN